MTLKEEIKILDKKRKRGSSVPLFFFILLLASCIGTKPFGLRKTDHSVTRSYYSQNKIKEIVRTRRIYIKDCPGCKEIVRTKKKQFLDNGRLLFKEKMKRRMYTAKLLRVKSNSYYDDGKIKEKLRFAHGHGYRKRYNPDGKLMWKKTYPKKKKGTKDKTDEPGGIDIGL
jgi:hypothetical protein